MALYTIGDLHLSGGQNKPMDVFGDKWLNHAEKLSASFSDLTADDLCVICGDLSWGMSLEQCREDFKLIDSFPCKKIILKGNHDYWWSTASKAYQFFRENGFQSIDILNNNSFCYHGISICGTRGWFYEEETGSAHDRKIMLREAGRLKSSLDSAQTSDIFVFLHYPPVYGNYCCDEIMKLLNDYHVKLCCYGHLHGKSCSGAFNGIIGCTQFKLVSGDYLNFAPLKVME